ncbi:MAG: serine hydrolase [Chloroflexota bacterium]
MKKSIFLMLVISLMLAACTSSNSQPTPKMPATQVPKAVSTTLLPTPNSLSGRLDYYIQTEKPNFSGTILVVRKDEILINKGYGLANQEWGIPNTPQTKFAIGSLTKSFTGMAILLLQEQGQLSVDDSICQYLSDCPDAWQPITLYHLLNHTSGIYNMELSAQELRETNICREYKPEEVIASFKKFLMFEPGKRFYYSNSGYFLLGYVIEKVTGLSYEEFIQENILIPLDMSESGYDRSSAIVKQRASGYSLSKSFQVANADCEDVSLKYAAGGLYSTVGDLHKWVKALNSGQLVPKKTLDKVFKSAVPAPNGAYANGWFISQHLDHLVILHTGGVYGFAAYLAHYPEQNVTVIVLSNYEREDPSSIGMKLARLVFDGK